MRSGDDVCYALFLQGPNNGRADHAAVASYVDFFLGLGAWHFSVGTGFESEKGTLPPTALHNIVAEMRMDLVREISEPRSQPLASAAESLATPAARPSPIDPKTPPTPRKYPR